MLRRRRRRRPEVNQKSPNRNAKDPVVARPTMTRVTRQTARNISRPRCRIYSLPYSCYLHFLKGGYLKRGRESPGGRLQSYLRDTTECNEGYGSKGFTLIWERETSPKVEALIFPILGIVPAFFLEFPCLRLRMASK